MKWFDGSIPEAIAEAKRCGRVFVVVITGDDAQSSELLSTWNQPQVVEAAQDCVAIRLDSDSEACAQFSQIYPVVVVPSSFFIGLSGIPLEVIASSVSADHLLLKICSVKQMHQLQTAGGTVPPPPQTESTTVPPQTQTGGAVSVQPQTEVTAAASQTGGVVLSQTKTEATVPESSSVPRETTSEETRAMSTEQKTSQKKKKNEPEESEVESERRKLGKELQEFKRKQEEDQTRRLLEERQKEKEEERAARERVRQQIAMDRAERAARYARTVQEENAAKEARIQAAQQEQEAKKEAAVRHRSSVARLQFRLPDGSSFASQFPASSLLREARQYALQEVGGVYGSFTMATMFPRREFTSEDLERSLTELELVPSASIVLLPQQCRSSSSLTSSSSSLWSLLSALLCPLLTVWRMISAAVFGPTPDQDRDQSGTSSGTSSGTTSGTSGTSGTTSGSSRSTTQPPDRQSLEKRPRNFKKEGKICRLRTQEDSEDENNTWNGNSTQQM